MSEHSFDVGDLVPGIVILSAAGERTDLGARELAGKIHVLALVGGGDAHAIHRQLSGIRAELDGLDALTVVIGAAGAEAPSPDWPIQLIDPDGEIAKSFGIANSGFVILDPARRVAAVVAWSDHASGEMLAACRTVDGRTRDDVVVMQPPVLIVPNVFERDFCRQLIDYWASHDKQADMVSSNQSAAGGRRAKATLKRRQDTPIVDLELTREVVNRLGRRAGPTIWKAFRTMANSFETFRVGCYTAEERGFFGRHWDNTTPGTGHRKLGMVVNLNAGEYEGGALTFPEFGHQRYRTNTGDAVIFSCSLLHEALPVTAGRRYGLFGFLFDEAGAKQLKERIAKEQAAAKAQ